MVVLLQALVRRRGPSGRVLVAVTLTYAGILVVVGGIDLRSLGTDLYGVGLVLVCAFTFAVYYLASDRWTRVAGSAPFTVAALTSASAMLVLGQLARVGTVATLHGGVPDALLMAGLVLFATVMPMLLMTEGVRRLGAQRSAVASTIGPPATMLMGVAFLGEHLGALQWIGAALIIAGIVVLQSDSEPRTA
jgi:drug/metabolite transporter (DMT)-like permease